MSVKICVKSLHKLEALSRLQAIVLGATHIWCGN